MNAFMSSKALDKPAAMNGMGTALSVILLILMGTLHPFFSVMAFLWVSWILLRYETGCMVLLFLLLPFAGIFKLSPGSASLFTYLELMYVAIHFVRRRFLLSRADLILLALAFFMTFAQVLSRTIAVTNMIKVLINLLMLEQFLFLSRPALQKKTYLWFVSGTILSSVCSLWLNRIFPIAQYLILNQVEQYGRYGEKIVRFAGLNVDPNYYTVNVILSLCLLIILYRRKEISTLNICVLAGILGTFAGLTGSKSAFLMLGAVVVIHLTACWQGKRYLMFTISCAGLVIGLAAVVSGRVDWFHGALIRLGHSLKDLNSFTTGRAGVWLSYLRYLAEVPKDLLCGRGVGIYLLNGRAAHNTALDMLYQLGIIGTGAYLWCLLSIVRRYWIPFRRRFLNYSGLLCVLVMYFFLSQLQGCDLPFHLFLCISVWNTQNETGRRDRPVRCDVGRLGGLADEV